MSLLGLNDSADNKSFIRFMPSNNGWFVGTDEEVDIKHILIDPGSVKTGWGRIQLGVAPDWSWDDAIGQRGLRPGESEDEKFEYKRGFSVDLFGQEIGLRTWSTTTTVATHLTILNCGTLVLPLPTLIASEPVYSTTGYLPSLAPISEWISS